MIRRLAVLILGLLLAGLVAACGPQRNSSPGAPDIGSPGTSVSTNPPPVTLLVEGPSSAGRYLLRAVDPGTLQDLPDLAPLDLGNGHNTAFSPDGRTLAAAVWPQPGHKSAGQLHLIDLPTWTDRITGIQFDGWVRALAFNPTGGTLYWIQFREQVHRYDLGTGTADLIGKLPASPPAASSTTSAWIT